MDVVDNKGGFAYAHWDGTTETEEDIKAQTKATIRCIPLGWPDEAGKCIRTGKPSERRVLFAGAYEFVPTPLSAFHYVQSGTRMTRIRHGFLGLMLDDFPASHPITAFQFPEIHANRLIFKRNRRVS